MYSIILGNFYSKIKFKKVKIAEDNQEIVNKSNWIFLAVTPNVGEKIIKNLKFKYNQTIISFISTIKLSELKKMIKVKSNIDSGMFYGIQKGAITALNQSTDWFTNLNKVYNDRREIAWKIADKLNTTYNKNSVGLFVWARIQENIDNVDLLVDELLYKKNIFITPGKIFGSKGNRYIRISLCTKQIFLNEALNRL